jgi:hypothetical protein
MIEMRCQRLQRRVNRIDVGWTKVLACGSSDPLDKFFGWCVASEIAQSPRSKPMKLLANLENVFSGLHLNRMVVIELLPLSRYPNQ